jgi:hypothetical protein
MDMLGCNDIAKGAAIVQYGCRGVITGGFNGEYVNVFGIQWKIWNRIWLCKGKKYTLSKNSVK